jgi:hypothetical protein
LPGNSAPAASTLCQDPSPAAIVYLVETLLSLALFACLLQLLLQWVRRIFAPQRVRWYNHEPVLVPCGTCCLPSAASYH